uniref:Insulin-like domain-containing protein n=1 Tax=Taeniopygia guttata TaxID=59729 RepID=A0A674GB98_TAEGU
MRGTVLALGCLALLLLLARGGEGEGNKVRLCGRDFIRAVVFTCGGSRWRRHQDLRGEYSPSPPGCSCLWGLRGPGASQGHPRGIPGASRGHPGGIPGGIPRDGEAAHPLLPSIPAAPAPAPPKSLQLQSNQSMGCARVPSPCTLSGSPSWAILQKKNNSDQDFPSSPEEQDPRQGCH